MEVERQICFLVRMALPVVGFSIICLGAFLISVANTGACTVKLILAYICITFGFLILLAGISWSICLGMKNKRFIHSVTRHQNPTVLIHTVYRPDFYPPSYAESMGGNTVSAVGRVVIEDGIQCIAPPIYTESSSGIVDQSFSLEEPPSYEETMTRNNTLEAQYPVQAASDEN